MAEKKKKDKTWYWLVSPQIFGKARIVETPSDNAENLYGRTLEVSMHELNGDFSRAHIKLIFRIKEVSGLEAYTDFIGHTTTTDYMKRIARRHRAKIDGVFDVVTKDGKRVRVKPSAYALKRLQTSQKTAIRKIMKEVIETIAKTNTFDDFVKLMIDGEMSKQIYKLSKIIYPVKRVEIHKSELLEEIEVKAKGEEEEKEEEVKEEEAEEEEEAISN